VTRSRIPGQTIRLAASALLGAVLGWMALGSNPFWVEYPLTAKIGLFIAAWAIPGIFFFAMLPLTLRLAGKLYKEKKNRKFLIFLILALLLTAFITRHEFPLSFSYSAVAHEFTVQQIAPEIDNSCPKINEVDLSIRPGNLPLRPAFLTNKKCDGNTLTHRYAFFANRLTSRMNLTLTEPVTESTIILSSTALEKPERFKAGATFPASRSVTLTEDRAGYFFSYAVDLGMYFLLLCTSFSALALLLGWAWKTYFYPWIDRSALWLIGVFASFFSAVTTLPRWKLATIFAGTVLVVSLFSVSFVHSLLWVFSLLAVIFTTFYLLALLRVRGVPAWVIGFTVLSYANVMFTTQLAGVLTWLDTPWLIALLHGILLTAGFALFKVKRPPLLPAWFRCYKKQELMNAGIRYWRSEPESLILLVFTGLAYLFIAFLALRVPSNMDDILTTYLPRAAFWVQQGNFAPWPTSPYNLPQVVYPLNGQLPLAWLISLWGNDALAGLLQYLSIPAGLAGIFGISRLLGATRKQGVFAGLVFLGLPNVVLISSTALSDLLTANFGAAFIYLLIRGVRENDRVSLTISALTLGIILGIKQTTLFLLPGICFLILLSIFKKKTTFKPVLIWLIITGLSFWIFGSFSYFRNFLFFGNLLGPEELTPYFTHGGDVDTIGAYLRQVSINTGKIIIRSLFDNTPMAFLNIIESKLLSFRFVESSISDFVPKNLYPLSTAWSGQIGFIFFSYVLIVNFYRSIKNRNHLLIGLLLVIVTYTLILIGIRNYTFAFSRYLLSIVILLASVSYHLFKHKTIRVILTINSFMLIIISVLSDGAKPLTGPNALWDKSRNELLNLQLFDDYLPTFEVLDQTIPADASLAYYLPDKFPQSVLFGEHFTRTLTQLDPEDGQLDKDDLAELNADYLVVQADKAKESPFLASLDLLDDDARSKVVIYRLNAPIQTDGR